MSPRLRDELRVVLHPGQLMMARVRRRLTIRGPKHEVAACRTILCEPAPGDDAPWSAALRELEAVMPDLAGNNARATVILSNHFMRYALVPWNGTLSNDKEEMAYARHLFGEIYGRDSRAWELRIDPGKAGLPQLAGAVNGALLGDLRQVFGRSRVGLKSIQPHLMFAYNACQSLLRGKSAWFALIERDSLCLSLLQEGQWSWIRTMRIGGGWHEELPLFLEREAFIANVEDGPEQVYLWAPDDVDETAVNERRWRFSRLQPAHLAKLEPGVDTRFAMYMGG